MHVDPILPSTFVTLEDVMSYSRQKNNGQIKLNYVLKYFRNGIILTLKFLSSAKIIKLLSFLK